MTPFGVCAVSVVAIVVPVSLIGLFFDSEQRLPRTVVAMLLLGAIASSRRRYREDLETIRQTLEGALRRTP